MLATVTIEVGYEHKDKDHPVNNSGYAAYLGLIDLRRTTNMLEVVKRCRLTCGLHVRNVLSEVHFKMLERSISDVAIFRMTRTTDVYQLKCGKHHDRKTGVSHSLTITVQAISVPRLEDSPNSW